MQFRVDRHEIVHSCALQAVARIIEYARLSSRQLTGKSMDTVDHFDFTEVGSEVDLESERFQRIGHDSGIVFGGYKCERVLVSAIANNKRYALPGQGLRIDC